MQIILITGRLTEDAALKVSVKQGVKNEFVSFSVACNEDRGDEHSATFYDVVMSKTNVLEFLKKGQQVSIVGRFRFSVTADDKGKQYPHLNVSVMQLELIGGKKPGQASEEDIPATAEQA